MAARSIFLHLKRVSADSVGRTNPFSLLHQSASASSKSNPIFASFLSSAAATDEPLSSAESDDLRSRIFRLRLPKRSATTVIHKWVGEGNSVSVSELRAISRELRRLHRYKHALEISEWMTSHDEFKLSDSDYAIRIDLMTKVFGIDSAERYFHGLPKSGKTKETYTALLHSYASAKLTDKAEQLFEFIVNDLELSLTAITYNEMMTLYMSVAQVEKVSSVVEEMKSRKVSPDLFTYNLWISSLASNLDISGVQQILEEMGSDSNCNEDWNRYRTLAKVYITSGQLSDCGLSSGALVDAQKGVTLSEKITYDLLILLHAGLGNKDMIDQIWKSLRMTNIKMMSRSYMCALSAYLILDSMKEVREVLSQWKQSPPAGSDESSFDRLRNALVEAGLSEKAETLRLLLVEKN